MELQRLPNKSHLPEEVDVEVGPVEGIHGHRPKGSSTGDGGALGCVETVTPTSRGVSAPTLRKPLSSCCLYPYVLNFLVFILC